MYTRRSRRVFYILWMWGRETTGERQIPSPFSARSNDAISGEAVLLSQYVYREMESSRLAVSIARTFKKTRRQN